MTPLPVPPPDRASPLLGAWGRSEGFVGLVAAVADGAVTLLDPAARQVTTVAAAGCERLPAGAVTVTVTLDLPLAHGLAEQDLRRWVASLLDPGMRERAAAALEQAGLDGGAALPQARLDVAPAQGGGALCLAGHRTPAHQGGPVACAACGRAAVGPPQQASPDVLGLG